MSAPEAVTTSNEAVKVSELRDGVMSVAKLVLG